MGLYDNKFGQGRIFTASILNDNININKKAIPKGVYDENILCEKCDNFLNQEYENYSDILFFDSTDFKIINGIITFENIDYQKLKLFFLSIFWRASISEQKYFKSIKFTQIIEDYARDLIISKNARNDDDFPVYLYYLNTNLMAQILSL